jgi:hypothetical protein
MRLWGDGFEVETLINIRIVQAGLTVKEVASYEHPRIHAVRNLNTFSDGMRVLRAAFMERYYARNRGKQHSRHHSFALHRAVEIFMPSRASKDSAARE